MKVTIPTSKSFYARVAMICAIAGIDIPYCDENDDIIAIREALSTTRQDGKVWVGSSGTAARFCIAYYATQEGTVTIDGSEQMRKRPISSIVEAVKKLGAEVEGISLPVTIKGCKVPRTIIEVDASQSSQTISALMLAGMRQGLTIKTTGEKNSWSYVELTAEVMRQFGIKVEIYEKGDDAEVRIQPMRTEIDTKNIETEKDWSSAVFWYGWCATRGEEIEIEGLKRGSRQPDEAAVEIFGRLGVVSEEYDGGILLKRGKNEEKETFTADCRRTPDLAVVLIPTLCKMGKRFTITGLDTLDRKESQRGKALATELTRVGFNVEWDGEKMSWNGDRKGNNNTTTDYKTETYNDHRMVMASLIIGAATEDHESLKKSYPYLADFFAK